MAKLISYETIVEAKVVVAKIDLNGSIVTAQIDASEVLALSESQGKTPCACSDIAYLAAAKLGLIEVGV